MKTAGGNRSPRRLGAALLCSLLAACASEPKYSPRALDEAEAGGRLEAIYQELKAPKSGMARLTAGDDEADLQAVVERLVRRDLEALRRQLDAARLSAPTAGLVPLSAFSGFAAAVEAPARWSAAGRERAVTLLTEERAKTLAAIADRRRQMLMQPRSAHMQRLALAAEVAALGGDGSAEAAALEQHRESAVTALLQDARSAIAADRADAADMALATLRQIDPGNGALPRLAHLLRLLRINAETRNAADPAAQQVAWQALEALAAELPLGELRPEADSALSELRSAQLVRASAALAADRLADCYAALGRARVIAGVLGETAPPPEENRFIDRLQRSADAAAARGASALEYGYRMVMHELQPETPMLRVTLQEAADRVREAALGTLAIRARANTEASQVLARWLVEQLGQRLGQRLPRDLRVVGARVDLPPAQLPAVEVPSASETSGSSGAAGPAATDPQSALPPAGGGARQADAQAAADWQVGLAIETATVEAASAETLRRQRVRTDTRQRSNPEHATWAALPEAERSLRPEPPATIELPVFEEVSIGVVQHRRRARLKLDYRLSGVEPGSSPSGEAARELLADTIDLDRSIEGESHGAIEVGEFTLPARDAGLPADGALLAALAEEALATIVERLQVLLAGQANRHLAAAEAAAAGQPLVEVEHRAAALLLMEDGGTDVAPLREALRQALLAGHGRF